MSIVSRGTTPTHTFRTSIDLTGAAVLFITYMQAGKTILEKDLSDCTITSQDVTVTLTQKESLRFKENGLVRMQIRGKFPDGSAVKSCIMEATADELLKEGVI